MKRTFWVILSMLFFALTCTNFAQQSQTGTYFANSKTAGYTLHENTGDRSVSIEVSFVEPFKVKPHVVISVSQLEVGNETTIRYNVQPKFISRDGFVIKISTWSDTRILQIGGSWIAISE